MNKEMLFAAMGGIDDRLLLRSEVRKNAGKHLGAWTLAAACLALLLGAGLLFKGTPPAPDNTLQTSEPPVILEERAWTPRYNEEDPDKMNAMWAKPNGYFYEDLTPAQLEQLLPQKASWHSCTASAGYFQDGTVDNAVLQLETDGGQVFVTLGSYHTCVIFGIEDAILSPCGDVIYEMYRHEMGPYTVLKAKTEIHGVPLHFSMQTKDAQAGARAFEAVLECFSWYEEEKPALSELTPSHIPEYIDEILTGLAQAQQDPEFGSLMPKSGPKGFREEFFSRHKDSTWDALYGVWTQGYNELSWEVRYFSQEDAARVTSVEATENYDLSLYPIPRADSVPEHLREIVNCPVFPAEELTLEAVRRRAYTVEDAGEGGTSLRMYFSVRFGDKLVTISAKGISPEWIYDQLMELK